jgi:hypothetical protein
MSEPLNHHVSYELQMLFGTRAGMKTLMESVAIPELVPGANNGQFLFNVLHEDFCLHAWNLIVYFDGLYPKDDNIRRILKMIDTQIVTLIPEHRTAKADEKISQEDRDALFDHVMALVKEKLGVQVGIQ